MTINTFDVKKILQDHLQEGLLLVAGSGLSAAEGIPGMWQLGNHLKIAMPKHLVSAPDPEWQAVVNALNAGDHLELAMGQANLLETTVKQVITETGTLIRDAELTVFQDVIDGKKILPLSIFLTHLFKAAKKFHLITPNYDRLIELAAEHSGIGVDTRFIGQTYGTSDAKRSADNQRESFISGKQSGFRTLPNLCVYKPHGSLDWFEIGGKIVRISVPCINPPVIITPGVSKYRQSFSWAFDDQRTSGNRAVRSATRYMFIGYGFNDDHLEQHICPGLVLDKPSIILARQLSDNAKKAISNSKNASVLAISAVSHTDSRTQVTTSKGESLVIDEDLWNLDGFNKGVL